MLLDAALRDAQIREEAERAYEKVQFERTRPVHERQESDPTRTPGSTLSDELPPLAPVTLLVDRYEHRGVSDDESPSDNESTGSIRMEDINSPSAPRRLRRAGDVDGSQSPERPRNAFDILKAGQLKRREDRDEKKKKDKAKKNDFIAEEVEESEDEGEYSMLRKIHEEGDDEDGSDLDATVEELVDDEKGDPDEEEAQDEMADDYHREWAVKQDAKDTKMVEKVIAGKMKRRRGEAGELDDSDYEDDDMHRVAKAKKPKQYSSKMEALSKFIRVGGLSGVFVTDLYGPAQLQTLRRNLSLEQTWMTELRTSTVISSKHLIQLLRQLLMRRTTARISRMCLPIVLCRRTDLQKLMQKNQ